MGDAVLTLGPTLQEPARARAFVTARLSGYSTESCADAVLLVSELVSNVVRHGALPAQVTLRVAHGVLRVVVADSGHGLPTEPGVAAPYAASGRGLLIVSTIARAWGVTTSPEREGKEVWFDLALGR